MAVHLFTSAYLAAILFMTLPAVRDGYIKNCSMLLEQKRNVTEYLLYTTSGYMNDTIPFDGLVSQNKKFCMFADNDGLTVMTTDVNPVVIWTWNMPNNFSHEIMFQCEEEKLALRIGDKHMIVKEPTENCDSIDDYPFEIVLTSVGTIIVTNDNNVYMTTNYDCSKVQSPKYAAKEIGPRNSSWLTFRYSKNDEALKLNEFEGLTSPDNNKCVYWHRCGFTIFNQEKKAIEFDHRPGNCAQESPVAEVRAYEALHLDALGTSIVTKLESEHNLTFFLGDNSVLQLLRDNAELVWASEKECHPAFERPAANSPYVETGRDHISLYYPSVGLILKGSGLVSADCNWALLFTYEKLDIVNMLAEPLSIPNQLNVSIWFEVTEYIVQLAITDVRPYWSNVLFSDSVQRIPTTVSLKLENNGHVVIESNGNTIWKYGQKTCPNSDYHPRLPEIYGAAVVFQEFIQLNYKDQVALLYKDRTLMSKNCEYYVEIDEGRLYVQHIANYAPPALSPPTRFYAAALIYNTLCFEYSEYNNDEALHNSKQSFVTNFKTINNHTDCPMTLRLDDKGNLLLILSTQKDNDDYECQGEKVTHTISTFDFDENEDSKPACYLTSSSLRTRRQIASSVNTGAKGSKRRPRRFPLH